MSYQTGIINNLINNTLEIHLLDSDEEPITESNIVSESMKLRQSICDGSELRFGGCIASEFSIKLMNTQQRRFDSLVGRWIAVKLTQHYADEDELLYPSASLYPSSSLYPGKRVNSRAFWIFSGCIESAPADKNDKNIFNVVAFDALAGLHKKDATNDFYQHVSEYGGYYLVSVLDNCVNMMEASRVGTASFMNEQYAADSSGTIRTVGEFNIRNEYWLSRKDKVTYGTLLRYVCEMLGVFGYIVPNSGKGQFTFKRLKGTEETYAFYESLTAEEYQSKGYTDFNFSISGSARSGKYELAGGLSDAPSGEEGRVYDFTDNILILQPYTSATQGRTTTPFEFLVNRTSIGTRLALNAESTAFRGQCAYSAFRPLTATLDGRLWVEPGTPVNILVNRTTVDGDYVRDGNGNVIKDSVRTYVLTRTLTGIQALTDKIEVKGAAS